MYYPILRGRQNELLAIQELLKQSKLSLKIIPVIEPVKLSPTFVNTLDAFSNVNHKLILIRNPKVGSFNSDARNAKNSRYRERTKSILQLKNSSIQRGLYVDKSIAQEVASYNERNIDINTVVVLCLKPDEIKSYENTFGGYDVVTMLPYAPAFRRIRAPKVLTEDKFNKKPRNAEYLDDDDEFFSDDHLYFNDGYIGFSDYSVIGDEYTESGFAPYAVAIHIVYFDNQKVLRVHHFVSDDNDDISDPAGKFYQALGKLHKWNKTQKLDTIAMQQFEEIYENQSYPGLGVVKKLSVMHHLELMSRFLDGEVL